ncbi:MAG: hypothetical protein NDI62_02005 [Burkholderiales bacterium]|nr:hypothetical protein [Burkholderiales bacterium]
MENEVKIICQNCKIDFVLKPEDFKFYEKIKVPPPTFCPECRTIRRLCWRNEMSLFKRKCDAPGHNEMLVSFIHPSEEVVVCDSKYWWGDEWNAVSFGKEYDFSKTFFTQWKELRDKIPLQSLSNIKATNSDYCNVAEGSKDSYLCSGSWQIDRTLYSNRITMTKECSDVYVAHRCELCYENLFCSDCYQTLYSTNCKSCVDSYFLYDCHGCINCFGCTNLRNKSYCMWNEQLSRDEYLSRLSEINLKSYKVVEELKEKFKEIHSKSLHRFSNQNKVMNSTGDNLEGVKNCRYSFDAVGNRIEDCKFIHWAAYFLKDAYDSGPGVGDGELLYESFDTGIGNFRNLFTSVVYSSNNVEYSFNCHGCDNIFGCIGLRTKKYCILNKQYTKEEYEELIPKIKQHMNDMPYIDKRGLIYKYGEFFPAEMSTFCYNETQAQDYFPLNKEEAIKNGYRWRDKKVSEYVTTIESVDLPDDLRDVDESILNEIIGCKNKDTESGYCRGAYKIILDEFNLYRKLGVPLPRFCFNCRHENRLKKRNPMKLWRRECMCENEGHGHQGKCLATFKTPYAPDRPEIVYCENCYNKEVY